jgi:protein-arginine kinase activator protein McsA
MSDAPLPTPNVVCQNCQRQPATVTRRVRTKGGAMQNRHECALCAEKRNVQRYGGKRKRRASS